MALPNDAKKHAPFCSRCGRNASVARMIFRFQGPDPENGTLKGQLMINKTVKSCRPVRNATSSWQQFETSIAALPAIQKAPPVKAD